MTELTLFRDAILAMVPRWLRATTGVRLLYGLGVCLDAVGDAAVAAVKWRYPGAYSDESLTLIGQHRGIWRGPNEPAATYAARLIDWLPARKREGNRYEMLREIQATLAPVVPVVWSVDNDGRQWCLASDGSFTSIPASETVPLWHEQVAEGLTWANTASRLWDGFVWDWDGHPEYISRFWIVLDNEHVGLTPRTETWDEQVAAGWTWEAPARLWDFEWNSLPETLRVVEEQFRPPHAHCDCIIVVQDWEAWFASMPDGDWDVLANRNTAAYYLTGT